MGRGRGRTPRIGRLVGVPFFVDERIRGPEAWLRTGRALTALVGVGLELKGGLGAPPRTFEL
jgi:hypothetical protein